MVGLAHGTGQQPDVGIPSANLHHPPSVHQPDHSPERGEFEVPVTWTISMLQDRSGSNVLRDGAQLMQQA